jgi:hypothetical protein
MGDSQSLNGNYSRRDYKNVWKGKMLSIGGRPVLIKHDIVHDILLPIARSSLANTRLLPIYILLTREQQENEISTS